MVLSYFSNIVKIILGYVFKILWVLNNTFRVYKLVGNLTSEHIPQFSDSKRNCKVCYHKDKKN